MTINSKNFPKADFAIAKTVPPAFAGLLVDWSIGSREITATIIDLITRGFLGVAGSKVFLAGKKSGLKNFEKNFIQKLFEQNNSLEFDEVENKAYKKFFPDLIKIICLGMIEEGFVDKDFQKKLANAVKESMKELYGININPSLGKEEIKKMKIIILPTWLERILRFVFQPFFGPIEKRALAKLGGSYDDFLLTAKGKESRIRLLELKGFMEKFPLLEDRLANELVGHAIAFGIGTKWMSKFGGSSAQLRILAEKLDDAVSTTMKFVDMNYYFKEFFPMEQ